jgi:peroxiredoxin
MVSLETPVCEFGLPAIDFSLLGTDNKIWTLDACRGENGLLIMFICNHCPYVKSILDRLVRDTRALKTLGVNTVAIMANDPADYPEDSFENMQKIAKQNQFPFPYLIDETQQVAQDLVPFVPLISLDTIKILNCSIAADLMKVKKQQPQQTYDETFSKP